MRIQGVACFQYNGSSSVDANMIEETFRAKSDEELSGMPLGERVEDFLRISCEELTELVAAAENEANDFNA